MNYSHISEALTDFASNVFYGDELEELEATEEKIFESMMPVYPYEVIRNLLNELCSAVILRQYKRIEELRNRLMSMAAVAVP